MKRTGTTTSLAALLAIPLATMIGLSGCDREGPAEKAGEKIDKGAEKVGEGLERAGEKAQDAVN